MQVQIVRLDLPSAAPLARRLKLGGITPREPIEFKDAVELGIDALTDLVVLTTASAASISDEIRQFKEVHPKMPVVVACPSAPPEVRAEHLNAGADDHVSLGIDPMELTARVVAITRRVYGHLASGINIGPLEVDIEARSATIQGETVHLSPFEYRLLEHLALRGGATVEYGVLETPPDCDHEVPSRNATLLTARRLRQKLSHLAGDDLCIETVRGIGLALVPSPAKAS